MKAIKCLLKTDKWQSYKEQKEEETQQVTRKVIITITIIIIIIKRIYISSIQSTDLISYLLLRTLEIQKKQTIMTSMTMRAIKRLQKTFLGLEMKN